MVPERLTSYRHDGLVFDVADAGPLDGVPVVLLHGWPQSSHCWGPLGERLHQAGFRTFAPDQRGYSAGASPAGRRKYRLPLLAADTIALIDAIGTGSVHLVGHDWGAVVAYAVTGSAPEQVRTLTTLAVPHPSAFTRSMFSSSQALRSWYMAFFQLPALPEFMIRRWPQRFVRLLESSGQTHERATRDTESLIRSGITTTLNWYRALPLADSRLGQMAVPTLHIYGARDSALTRKGAELTGRFVTGPYELQILEDASHWIPEEAPDTVAELFIRRAEWIS